MSDLGSISGHTKLVALIGSPVEHSLSPAMHNASFARMGVDCAYVVFDVVQDDLPTVVDAFKRMGLVGFNVTMPCKTDVLAQLDTLSDAAELMGAVNTVVIEDGKAHGHNTDGAGFMRNLAEEGFECKGKRMVLTGAGGAGSAIMVQAALDGMAQVDVFNRKGTLRTTQIEGETVMVNTFDTAQRRAAHITEKTGVPVIVHDIADEKAYRAAVDEADIYVNATNMGMTPNDSVCLLPEDYLHDGMWVADVIYNPLETKLMRMAREHGNPVVGGLGMVLWQGALAEEIWVGQQMDVDYIKNLLYS